MNLVNYLGVIAVDDDEVKVEVEGIGELLLRL